MSYKKNWKTWLINAITRNENIKHSSKLAIPSLRINNAQIVCCDHMSEISMDHFLHQLLKSQDRSAQSIRRFQRIMILDTQTRPNTRTSMEKSTLILEIININERALDMAWKDELVILQNMFALVEIRTEHSNSSQPQSRSRQPND